MTDNAQPNIRYANRWLEDAVKTLAELAHELNDSRLMDLRATLADITQRGKIIPRYSNVPTTEQVQAIADGLHQGKIQSVTARPFELPDDYLLVTFDDGYTLGIAPDGRVST